MGISLNREADEMEVRQQLVAKMNDAIDKLIENRQLMKQIISDPQCAIELAALEKTQESLLAHLAHLHTYRQNKRTSPSKATFALHKEAHRLRVKRHPRRRKAAIL